MANKRNDWGDNSGNYFDEMQSHPNTLSEQLFLEAVHGRFGRVISFTMIASHSGGHHLVAMSDCLLDMAIPSGLVGM